VSQAVIELIGTISVSSMQSARLHEGNLPQYGTKSTYSYHWSMGSAT